MIFFQDNVITGHPRVTAVFLNLCNAHDTYNPLSILIITSELIVFLLPVYVKSVEVVVVW